jgi:hypothetical protein
MSRISLAGSFLFLLPLVGFGAGCGRTEVVVFGGQADDDTGSIEIVESGTSDDPTDTEGWTTDDPPPDLPVGECAVDQQCQTGDPCEMGVCANESCMYSALDLDEDGFGPQQCSGQDCNDFNPNTFPGADENCFDGDDNDCNGVADCLDPLCEGVPNCGCTPAPGGEDCMNGQDDDCDTTVDCLDTDCLGTDTCGCTDGEAGLCVNGFDDDCDGAIDCDDNDCAGTMECQCPASDEVCNNGLDDDCDLTIDCADPECAGTFQCTCMGPPAPEACDDNFDNDCDMLVDCADPNCFVAPACDDCEPEMCDDGLDNDCNLLIDCADPSCAFDPGCMPVPEICNNELDDDNDGLVDCDDLECVNVPICQDEHATCETAALIPGSGTYMGDTTGHNGNHQGSCGGDAGEAVYYFVLDEASHVVVDSIGTTFDSVVYVRRGVCANGQQIGCDDDSGGFQWSARLDFTILYPGTYFVFLDGYTIDENNGPDEGPYTLNIEITPNPPEVCDDAIDNDGDVYVDCADPECTNAPGCDACNAGNDPTAEFGAAACTDGQDNDCDGDFDCEDDDCSASDFYVTECCNDLDENDNGIPDDFNCRCNNSSECPFGQMCYTHTASTCGIPCTSFNGDVCPFVAPGSFCNQATDQCEFP